MPEELDKDKPLQFRCELHSHSMQGYKVRSVGGKDLANFRNPISTDRVFNITSTHAHSFMPQHSAISFSRLPFFFFFFCIKPAVASMTA